jgi:hypothetical protein
MQIFLKKAVWSWVFGIVICWVTPCRAADSGLTLQQRFDKGTTEVQVLSGAFFSIDAGNSTKPTTNFAFESVRCGIMLGGAGGAGFFRGNAEFLMEAVGGQVFAGPGSGFIGLDLMIRYNFVQPRARVIPYCQVGAGGAYNDIASTQTQSLVGSEYEFSLQAGLGIRFLLADRVSLMIEQNGFHLSNAGLAERNHGLNTLGGLLGVSVSF